MSVSDFVDLTKVPAKFIAIAAIVTGLVLFLPVDLIPELQLADFKKDYGKFIGVLFLASTGLTIFSGISWFATTITHTRRSAKQKRDYQQEIKEVVEDFDPNEKAVIREFALQRKRTLSLPINDATVSGLMKKGVLEMVSTFGNNDHTHIYMPVGITKYAESILRPSHIGVTENITDAEYNQLMRQRPDWAKNWQYWSDIRKNRHRLF